MTRYLLTGDNSGHTYCIPAERSDEWGRWLEMDEDDPRSWEPPTFAMRVDGRFTFTDPRCG